MKKKFLLIALAAMALASCDNTGDSTSTSTKPEPKNISLTALKSIFGTFTAEGTDKIVYSDFNYQIDNNIYVAFGENEVEIGFNEADDKLEKQKFYNNNGYIAIEYRNVRNEVTLANLIDYNDENIPWVFNNNLSTSVKVTDFVSTEQENVFSVSNSETRMLIARTLLTDLYYPIDDKTGEDPAVESMFLTVNNDVITSVTFKTVDFYRYDERYDYGEMDPFFLAHEIVNLTLSNHSSTDVTSDVAPYETYAEAAALTSAFQEYSDAEITADIKYYRDDELFLDSENYYLSDLYYGVTNGEAGGYVYVEEAGLVEFSVVEDKVSAVNLFDETIASAGLTYTPNAVAAEMFKYEDGKYVTRSIEDAQNVSSYLLLDGSTELISSNISITLNTDSMFFEYELKVITSSNVIVNYVCTMEVKKYVEGSLTLDLEPMKEQVRIMSTLNTEMLGTFTSVGNTLDIDTLAITLNGTEVVVINIADNVITGTYNGQEVTLTYTSKAVENDNGILNISTFDIAIAGAEPVQVTFDSYLSNLVYIFNLLGVEALPAIDGAKYYHYDLSQYQSTGIILFAIEADETKGSFTEDDLKNYLNGLNTNYFADVSDVPANEIFLNNNSPLPIKTYLGVSFAYMVTDETQTNLALAGFYVLDGLIIIYVM